MKSLKLNAMANQSLIAKEMSHILGGGEPGTCCCGCLYEGQPGGSTSSANHTANDKGGLTSPRGCTPVVEVRP